VSAGRSSTEVATAVADAHRREWGFVLAATLRVAGDVDRAEECVQDAYARALSVWESTGIPDRPGAWLTTVARRRALDLIRRDATAARSLPLLANQSHEPDLAEAAVADRSEIPDDRLRLICTCCHPALAREAQVALTLRLLCGLSTAEVARAFLVSEPTMAARLTRAKKKIAAANIPYRVPPADELPERLDAVLDVIHLVFTTGHTAPVGGDLVRQDLVERGRDLARMMSVLLPRDPNVLGLLALIVLTDSRRHTRTDRTGRLLLLEEQDRSQWDAAAIREGLGLVREALSHRPPGRFALQAAIAAVHASSPTWDETDWSQIVELYDELCVIWPSPVVALNRAVAIGLAQGPEAGLAAIEELRDAPALAGYRYLPAARAQFLRRIDRVDEARAAYAEAIALTDNAVEREFLEGQLQALSESVYRDV
jgi:RNA polymerase sigma-70 factor (ECF subfamily)